MHAKLRIPSGITWTPASLLADIAALATGQTDVAQLGLLTLDTAVTPADAGIVATIPAGWELIGSAAYGDAAYPARAPSNTGNVAITLRSPIDDSTGRYKYLAICLDTSGSMYMSLGDNKRSATIEPYFRKNGVSTWVNYARFSFTSGSDISLNISARHFSFQAVTYIPTNYSFFLMERLQTHPGDIDLLIPPFALMVGYGGGGLGIPAYPGFATAGTISTASSSAVINGDAVSTYTYSSVFGCIESDGVYRAQLCPVTFCQSYGTLGQQHPDIPVYFVGRVDCPLRELGQQIVLGGRRFEVWGLMTIYNNPVSQPVFVEVM
jgi:hypothetical protein